MPGRCAGDRRCRPGRPVRDGLRPAVEYAAVAGVGVPDRGDAARLSFGRYSLADCSTWAMVRRALSRAARAAIPAATTTTRISVITSSPTGSDELALLVSSPA